MKESPEQEHTRAGNDYQQWKHTAQELFAAAAVLNRERERVEASLKPGPAPIEVLTSWIELMLVAFGIECLIKAIWLKQGNQFVRDGKYVSMPEGEGHRPEKMCRVVGIVLNQCENETLTRLSDIAGSIARYPIPKRPLKTSGRLRWSSPTDDDIIENLIVRVKKELK